MAGEIAERTVIIGSDHAGFALKERVIEELQAKYQVIDMGTDSPEPADYPEIAEKVCRKVLELKSPGILICGSGIGMSIAANRIKGIRAARCASEYDARISRNHNDANVLCLGERTLSQELALSMIFAWLETGFSNEERHKRRIGKIDGIENQIK